MSGDNVIKVKKIKREDFTEYRVEVRSSFAIYDLHPDPPDEFVAGTLANQLREFVNASVLGECIEIEYKKLEGDWTCPCCGARISEEDK